MSGRLSPKIFAAIGLPLTLLVAMVSLAHGPEPTTLGQTLRALLDGLGLATADGNHALIVNTVRLPRIATALLVGAALALAGTTMQAVFRNPLASPDVLGTMLGAAFGAVVAIATGFSGSFLMATPLAALAGAALTTALVYALGAAHGTATTTGLLLAGIALNSLLGAAISFITLTLAPNFTTSGEILFWLMGGLEARSTDHVLMVGLGLLVFGFALLPFARDMDLLTLEDEAATTLGVPVRVLRHVLLLLSCGLTAVAVSCTGGVAFVGLVVPHLVRLVVGPGHRGLLPAAALGGAFVLVLADTACRLAPIGVELRLGIVTSALGAPFFLLLLARHRRGRPL